MADTLEEIYKATLTESSFNASGEATVLTTDANTRYAIKDVQVKQESTSINVNADLLVNDMPVANVTNSVSGSEIIGPSSTVKLKTSTFPLNYKDVYFGYFPNTSNVIDKKKKAFVNDIEDTGLGFIANHGEALQGPYSNDTYMAHYQVHNGVSVRIRFDGNSGTQLHVYNSSGTQIESNTSSYTPKAFDQKRYVYWKESGTNFKRYDTQTDTTTNITFTFGSGGVSSYPRLVYAGEDWFWGSPQYGGGGTPEQPYIFNAATETFTHASNNSSGQTTYGYSNDAMWAVYNEGVIHVIRVNNTSSWSRYEVNTSTGAVSGASTFSGNDGPDMYTTGQWMDTHDNKLWYYNASNKLAYWDPKDGKFTDTGQSFSTTTPRNGRGHIFIGHETPSSSTINARTYTIEPSATYRITGVKSV